MIGFLKSSHVRTGLVTPFSSLSAAYSMALREPVAPLNNPSATSMFVDIKYSPPTFKNDSNRKPSHSETFHCLAASRREFFACSFPVP